MAATSWLRCVAQQQGWPDAATELQEGPTHMAGNDDETDQAPRAQAAAGSGVYLSHRLRITRRPEGAEGARCKVMSRGVV